MIFAQYLDNHLKDFDETWSEVRQNDTDSLRYSGSYQPKSMKTDLDLWMIQCSHIQFSGVHISSCLFMFVVGSVGSVGLNRVKEWFWKRS